MYLSSAMRDVKNIQFHRAPGGQGSRSKCHLRPLASLITSNVVCTLYVSLRIGVPMSGIPPRSIVHQYIQVTAYSNHKRCPPHPDTVVQEGQASERNMYSTTILRASTRLELSVSTGAPQSTCIELLAFLKFKARCDYGQRAENRI